MKKNNSNILLVSLFIFSFTYPFEKKKIVIWLAGDSTMSIKETKSYPETGWGMPFSNFFDSTVQVKNIAKNGRSTKTFIIEKLWDSIQNNLSEGDYVFIQFGHNDEAVEKKERYASPDTFQMNLQKFINETRAKKANPILITPVSRRKFNAEGIALPTHEIYSALVKSVATKLQVSLIDLDLKSMQLYQQFGPEVSKLLFLQLKPGEHPNYPDGKEDNTHFNELGARLIAQIVLAEIKNLPFDLKNRIVIPKKK